MNEEDLELLMRKRADYGTQNINITGLYGVAVRLQDKVSRLLNLTKNDKTANFESLEDTLKDIRNYGRIADIIIKRGEW
jgi:hypothetical protein